MFLFDLQFRYSDESDFRPYVVNCDISRLAEYSQHVANLCCVAQINIDIFSPLPHIVYSFHEYTI